MKEKIEKNELKKIQGGAVPQIKTVGDLITFFSPRLYQGSDIVFSIDLPSAARSHLPVE